MSVSRITATTPRGTFSRRSPRPYQFVIVSRGRSEIAVRRSVQVWIDGYALQIERYRKALSTDCVLVAQNYNRTREQYTPEQLQGFIDSAQVALTECVAGIPVNIAAESAVRPFAYGWSQSRLNAEKMVKRAQTSGHTDVTIEAVDGTV